MDYGDYWAYYRERTRQNMASELSPESFRESKQLFSLLWYINPEVL